MGLAGCYNVTNHENAVQNDRLEMQKYLAYHLPAPLGLDVTNHENVVQNDRLAMQHPVEEVFEMHLKEGPYTHSSLDPGQQNPFHAMEYETVDAVEGRGSLIQEDFVVERLVELPSEN